jgi:hypothetical protein
VLDGEQIDLAGLGPRVMSRSGSLCIRPFGASSSTSSWSTPRSRPSNAFWLFTASLTTTLASRPANRA